MKFQPPKTRKSFCILAAFLFMTACVSVNVRPALPRKAEDLQFTTPAKPFEKQKSDAADFVWQSQKTGNTIAVISECKGSIEIPLEALETDTINAMGNPEIEKAEKITYNERDAIQTTASGTMDGVAVKMKVVTFKKNSCNFILTYVGLSRSFSKEESTFDTFLKGFKAP